MNNSVKQIVSYLKDNPFSSENQIINGAFSVAQGYSNKKYKDMLRRGLRKGIINRKKVNLFNSKSRFFYYIPK
jgi:hypothetical protein